MLRKATLAAASLALGLVFAGSAMASGGALHPEEPKGGWTFDGPLGTFDQGQLQRGYKVYREVCSSCHAMSLLSFRNLGEKSGPFYDPEHPNPNDNPYVKALAADVRLGVLEGDFHWHKHDAEDEFFLVLEGELVIELEGRDTVRLRPHQGFTVPRGVLHKTSAPVRTVLVMVEPAAVVPTGD